MEFFSALRTANLPSPAEIMDNLLLMLAQEADRRPGKELQIVYGDEKLLGTIGAVEFTDARWKLLFQSRKACWSARLATLRAATR